MRPLKNLPLAVVLWLLSISGQAQIKELFAPFDCREHAEFFYNEPVEELVLNIDSLMMVVEAPVPQTIDTINGWKHWHVEENYTFGKDRGAMHMIADLDALHPYFRDKIKELITTCHEKGIELAIVESYRTHAKQNEYKVMGKKYTSSGAGRSKHQYGLAVDVVPIIDSIAVWDNTALWKKVGVEGEKLGLRWGGRWRKPYDPGHFEWTGGLTSIHLTHGQLPIIPQCDERYPCMNEDIKLLQKFWKEWETSQGAMTRK